MRMKKQIDKQFIIDLYVSFSVRVATGFKIYPEWKARQLMQEIINNDKNFQDDVNKVFNSLKDCHCEE